MRGAGVYLVAHSVGGVEAAKDVHELRSDDEFPDGGSMMCVSRLVDKERGGADTLASLSGTIFVVRLKENLDGKVLDVRGPGGFVGDCCVLDGRAGIEEG